MAHHRIEHVFLGHTPTPWPRSRSNPPTNEKAGLIERRWCPRAQLRHCRRTSSAQPTCPNCSTTSLGGLGDDRFPLLFPARHGHQFHRPSSSPLRHLTFVKRHAAKRTRGDAVRLGVGNEEPAERSNDHEPSRPSREPTEHTLSPAIRLPRPVHPHPLQDLAAGSDQPGCGQIWPGSKLTTIGARRGNVAGSAATASSHNSRGIRGIGGAATRSAAMKAVSERSVAEMRVPAKPVARQPLCQPSRPTASSATPAITRQWLHLWLHSPRSVRPGSGHARADDLPILLGRSLLISGSTTLKASVPRGTGGSNPSASATSDQAR